jgi:ActR/RegA family two-component response regulator
MTASLATSINALSTAATAAFASPANIHSLVAAIQPQVTVVLTNAASVRNTHENYYWRIANATNQLTTYLAATYPTS